MSAFKKKMWGVVVNPRLYKFYSKVIDKSLHVLPSPDFDGHEVFPGLWVGDIWAAYNLQELKKRKITHVVTCVLGIGPIYPQEFKYLNVQIRDVEDENICDHFEEVIKFIDEGRAVGNVFLHCLRGVSRSGTIAAAYIIYRERVPQEEAIRRLRQKRHVIDPNPSFLQQLDAYYQLVTSTTTTTIPATPTTPALTTTTTTTTTLPTEGVIAAEPGASSGGVGEAEAAWAGGVEVGRASGVSGGPEETTTITAEVLPVVGEGGVGTGGLADINSFTTISSAGADPYTPPTTLIIHPT